MNNPTVQPVVHAQSVCKQYTETGTTIQVLHALDLCVMPGECIAIIGASGCGKSTLLHLLAGLEKVSAGTILIDGQQLSSMSAGKLNQLRNRALGFIYQMHHLLPELSCLENVAMPLLIRGYSSARAQKEAAALLDRVGLSERLDHRPSELSGGQRQRAAIARALVSNPRCVLADEPTGNLDEKAAEEIQQLMLELNRELQVSFIVTTHNMRLARQMPRTLRLAGGKLTDVVH